MKCLERFIKQKDCNSELSFYQSFPEFDFNRIFKGLIFISSFKNAATIPYQYFKVPI
jgi:hypothetical protein